MAPTVQRFRFIAVAVLSILVLTIIGAVSLSPAYAQTMTLIISPNPALLGQTVIFSGTVTPPMMTTTPGDSIEVIVYSSNCILAGDIGFTPLAVGLAPLGPPLLFLTGTADSGGVYSIPVSGLSAGSYGAEAFDESYHIGSGAGHPLASGCDPFTVSATPIPEYPYGLAFLGIFMIIGYGVIRRKAVTKVTKQQ